MPATRLDDLVRGRSSSAASIVSPSHAVAACTTGVVTCAVGMAYKGRPISGQ
jgi:hypothetical protein